MFISLGVGYYAANFAVNICVVFVPETSPSYGHSNGKSCIAMDSAKVFFLDIDIFFSSGRGPFLVTSAPEHTESPPEHHGANVGPARGPWHVLWEFKAVKIGT